MRILTLVSALVFIATSCFGQNLIERTKLGLSCQSTDTPNQLSIEVNRQKSSRVIKLFSWDNRKSSNPLDEVNLKLSRKQLNQLISDPTASLKLGIPVSTEQQFNINLTPFKVQSDEGQLLTPDGPIKRENNMQFYRGTIEGDHGSLVTASIINGDLHISISDQDGVYRISPNNNNKSNNYSIWIDNSLIEKEFTCGVDESFQNERHPNINITPQKENNQKAAGDIIQVYVECDFELRNDKGSVSATEAFVTQLFAEIITLYANENINMEVSNIFVWTSTDPYAGNENLNTVLDDFAMNRQDNYNGRLATLLKGNISNFCSIAGLANVDVLCSTYSNTFGPYGPYNVNKGIGYCGTIGFGALEVSVVAHELGHNIGSHHTHRCVWGPNNDLKIDACGDDGFGQSSCSLVQSPTPPSESNTIMSYCSPTNFTNGFGTEPGDLIRSKVAAANCLVSGSDPCTDVNKTYNNTTVSNTTVRADNNITLNNNVNVASGALVNWFFENELIVNGTFTVPNNAILEAVVDDCE